MQARAARKPGEALELTANAIDDIFIWMVGGKQRSDKGGVLLWSEINKVWLEI